MSTLSLRCTLPCCLTFLFGIASLPTAILAGQTPAPAKQDREDAAVQAQMRNVMYHFTESVAAHIQSLDGQLIPNGDSEFPVFDSKESFTIRIDFAEISIRAAELGSVLNSYVFARADSPIKGVSISIENGRLKVKGRLHDKGDIPFETEGTVSATPDGKVRLHSEKLKALHVPVKGLMDLFGIDMSDLIKAGKVSGVQAEGNDLILDIEQILPAPHIQGKVTAIRVQGDSLVQTFGESNKKSANRFPNGSYMAYRGNRLRFGKLTMTDADVALFDVERGDPLDFYLDHYQDQLVSGYTKITPTLGLRAYVKDFNKLRKVKPTTSGGQSN